MKGHRGAGHDNPGGSVGVPRDGREGDRPGRFRRRPGGRAAGAHAADEKGGGRAEQAA